MLGRVGDDINLSPELLLQLKGVVYAARKSTEEKAIQ